MVIAAMSAMMPTTPLTVAVATVGAQSLPPELLLEVMGYLDLDAVGRLVCTCRTFSNPALLCQHSGYSLVLALLARNVQLYRTILTRTFPHTFLPNPIPTPESSPPLALYQSLRACLWVLAAHLNEPSPHFWAPLAPLAVDCVLSSAFISRLVTTAVTRRNAAGLSAFANFSHSTAYCSGGLHADHPLLDFGRPIPAIATAPAHIKSDLVLALFNLAHPICTAICTRAHSSRDMLLDAPINTCALRKLTDSNDLGVIVPGLLFLGQTQVLDRFWVDHLHSGNKRAAVPAIACLLSELVRRGRRDLFDILMRVWVLVLAGGVEAFLNDEQRRGREENQFPCAHMALERPEVHKCVHWLNDFHHEISAQLSMHGILGEQAKQLHVHFNIRACSFDLPWILSADMSYLWSIPQVLDAWIEWLLTHTLVSLRSALLIAHHLPTLIVHLRPSTLLLVLDRVPLRSAFGSPLLQRAPPTFSDPVQPFVSPYPLVHAMVAAHVQTLGASFDSNARIHPSWITRSDAEYWSSHLPLVDPKYYVAIWAWAFARAMVGETKHWTPVMSLPFVRIVDTLVHRRWFVDALRVLRDADRMVTGSNGECRFQWWLADHSCRHWPLQAAGATEFLVYVREQRLGTPGVLNVLDELDLTL